MPFGPGWNYENYAINKTTCCNHTFRLPDYFVNAKEPSIVVRQAGALFGKADNPFDYQLNDVILMSDFVSEQYLPFEGVNSAFNLKDRVLNYVCLVNGPNMKNMRFKYRWGNDKEFHFAFATIEGASMIPTSWLIDLLLVWR